MVLESIVQQSKLFAYQKGVNLEFCLEELLAFIGVNIAMGILRLPQIRDYFRDYFLAVWWKDRRDTFVMSTMHNTSATTVMKRPKGEHDKRPTPCPTAIADYNTYMGGVDLSNQLLSYYSMTARRTLKWWKKVLW